MERLVDENERLGHIVVTLLKEEEGYKDQIKEFKKRIEELEAEVKQTRQDRLNFLNTMEHQTMAFQAHNAKLQLELLNLDEHIPHE